MKRILCALAIILSWVLACPAQSPLAFTTVSGSTVTYPAGTVMVNGTATSYPAGSLSGFTASMGDCSNADIANGTANCDYIFMPAAGGALQTSNVYGTAYPYIVG